MDLNTLRRLVNTSYADDWSRVGGGFGPVFLESHGEVLGGSGDQHWLEVESHHSLYVFRADVALSLAHGLERRDDKRHFPWHDKFPDQGGSNPYMVDLLWNGSLVHREVGVYVDGGRALIPMPQLDRDGVEWVSTFQERLFGLVDDLGAGRGEYPRYFQQTGIEVR